MNHEATPLRGGVIRSLEQGIAVGSLRTPADVEQIFNMGRFDLVVEGCRKLLAEIPDCRREERKFLSFLQGHALIRLHRIAESDAFRIEAVLSGDIPEDSLENALLVNVINFFEGNYQPIIEETSAWLEGCEDLPRVARAHLSLLRGMTHGRLGNIPKACSDVEFAHTVFSETEAWADVFQATKWLGLLACIQGKLQVALGWYERCMELVEFLDVKEWIASNLINLGILYYKMGRLEEAENCLGKVFELDRLMVMRKVFATIALGNVYRMQGKFDSARNTLHDSLRISREENFLREEALSLEFLGDVERDAGNPLGARRLYAQALKLGMNQAPRGDLVMELQRREGECLDLLGRFDDAEAMLQRSLELAQGLGDKFEQGVILRCLGVNAANRRQYEQADKYFAQSLRLLVKFQAGHEEMILRLKVAQVHSARIDEDLLSPEGHVSHLDQAWGFGLAAQRLAGSMSEGFYHAEIERLVNELTKMRLQRRIADDGGKEAVGEGS